MIVSSVVTEPTLPRVGFHCTQRYRAAHYCKSEINERDVEVMRMPHSVCPWVVHDYQGWGELSECRRTSKTSVVIIKSCILLGNDVVVMLQVVGEGL